MYPQISVKMKTRGTQILTKRYGDVLTTLNVNLVAFSQDLDEATKHILEALDQRKLQEVGEKVGVGKFRTASLEKNKKLSMFNTDQTTKTTG